MVVVPAAVRRLAVVAVVVVVVVVVVVDDGRTRRQRLQLGRFSLVVDLFNSGRGPFGSDSHGFGTGRSGPMQRRNGLLGVWFVL